LIGNPPAATVSSEPKGEIPQKRIQYSVTVNSKKMKIKFKAGRIGRVFKITPSLQIEWNPFQKLDFAIVLVWFIYAVGIRFTINSSRQLNTDNAN